MSTTTRTLQAIKFDRDNIKLEILDQLLLPYSTSYIPINNIEDAFKAIKLMQVRGAPAIAIVGAFSVVVEVSNYLKQSDSNQKTIKNLNDSLNYLITSRPTAVNLANALNDIKQLLQKYINKYMIMPSLYTMKI